VASFVGLALHPSVLSIRLAVGPLFSRHAPIQPSLTAYVHKHTFSATAEVVPSTTLMPSSLPGWGMPTAAVFLQPLSCAAFVRTLQRMVLSGHCSSTGANPITAYPPADDPSSRSFYP
jgi:hypothetical protein